MTPDRPRTVPTRILSIHPHGYGETKEIGDAFRKGTPLIANLSDVDDVAAERLADFMAGLVFGLSGSIEKITTKIYLLSPSVQHRDALGERERSLMALRQSIQSLGDAATHLKDPLSPPAARAVVAAERAWRSIEEEFGMLSSVEVAELMGARSGNRTFASHRRSAGKLLGVRRGNRYVYPGFQFDRATGVTLPVLEPLLKLANEAAWSPESVALWSCGPSRHLDDKRPVDALVGNPELVLEAAEKRMLPQW